jgi:hypothetical protein
MEGRRLTFRQTLILAAATPLLAGVANLTWTFAGEVYEQFRLASLLTQSRFKIPVDPQFARLTTLYDIKCLLVRYGTEQYLKGLATEKDKLDGQRRLDLLPVKLTMDGGQHHLEFTLPVHQYLGTQFKLFATPKEGSSVADLKAELDTLTADLESVAVGGPRKDKVYFILKAFWQTSAEGIFDTIQNNFVPPQ